VTDKQKIIFAIDNIDFEDQDLDSHFVTAKIDAFSTGDTLNKTTCDVETLTRTASTIYEKPIIFELDEKSFDFGSHNDGITVPAGFIMPDSASFRELPDGRIQMSVLGKVWRKYSGKFIDIFRSDNTKKKQVSVEVEVYDSEKLPNGFMKMIDFAYMAICILGDQILGASKDAQIELMTFAAKEKAEYQEAIEFEFGRYDNVDFSIPDNIKNNVEKGIKLYREYGGATSVILSLANHIIKNSKATSEKIRYMAKIHNSKKFYQMKKSPPSSEYITYMLCGGNEGKQWSQTIAGQLDELDNTQVSYFGDIMTFPYDSLKDVNPALKGIEPSISLVQANQIATQADAIGTDEKKNGWAIAISQFKKNHIIKDGKWVKKEKLNMKDLEKDKKEEVMAEKEFEDVEKKKEEETPVEDKAIMAEDEDKKKAEETAKTKEEEVKKEKAESEEFSLDANLDTMAMLAFLENETESYKKLVAEMKKPKGINYAFVLGYMYDYMQKITTDMTKIQEENKVFATENEELKAFKASEDAKAFQFAIESTLKEIESTVEMPKNEIEALRESAKGFSLETIDAWKNSAKAKAFSFSSKKVEKDEKVKGAGLPWIRETTSATGSLWKR